MSGTERDDQDESKAAGLLKENEMPAGAKKAMAFLTSPAVLAAKKAAKTVTGFTRGMGEDCQD